MPQSPVLGPMFPRIIIIKCSIIFGGSHTQTAWPPTAVGSRVCVSKDTAPHHHWNINPLAREPQLLHLHIHAPVGRRNRKVEVPMWPFCDTPESPLSSINLWPLAGKKPFSKSKNIKACYRHQLVCDALSKNNQSLNSVHWSVFWLPGWEEMEGSFPINIFEPMQTS